MGPSGTRFPWDLRERDSPLTLLVSEDVRCAVGGPLTLEVKSTLHTGCITVIVTGKFTVEICVYFIYYRAYQNGVTTLGIFSSFIFKILAPLLATLLLEWPTFTVSPVSFLLSYGIFNETIFYDFNFLSLGFLRLWYTFRMTCTILQIVRTLT